MYTETQDFLVALVSALQTLPASRHLPSTRGGKNLLEDLSRLMTAVNADDFDIEQILPLLQAILHKEPDRVIWDRVYDAVTKSTPPPRPTSSFQHTPLSINTGSFANSTEHRKHVDDVLKEELGHLYVGIPGFFEALFGDVPGLRPAAQAVFDKCKEGESPLFRVESGWEGWPEGAKEKEVLSWFAPLTDRLLDLAEGHRSVSRVRRRPLAQPHQPLKRLQRRSQAGHWLCGRSERRRGLKTSMVTDPYTWRAQEQSVSRQSVQGVARPWPIREGGARRSRQPPLRSWLHPLWILDAAMDIRSTRGHRLRAIRYQ